MSKAKWIWFPDDFEIELANKFMAKRYERDVFIPPFWKQYSCYKNVKFSKTVDLQSEEAVCIKAEGRFNVELNGAYVYNLNGMLHLPKGKTKIVVSVYNDVGIPCLYIEGDTVFTDDSWQVTCNDHVFYPAKCDNCLIGEGMTPNSVSLPVKEVLPVAKIPADGGIIYDFGRELFAFIRLSGVSSTANPIIYYGESLQEVSDPEHCELISTDLIVCDGVATTTITKAFRYVRAEGIEFGDIIALFEYLPMEQRSSFECNDTLLNEIYKVSLYTLSLNTREFLIDGIKRDRWVWGGDAYQSYLMHYYSFFDKPVIKRTMTALFGRSPFDLYNNHIMVYTFFWIIGFYDYYEYTGDEEFVKDNLYKVYEVMDHCLGRRDENGLMNSRPEDWVFIDWANIDNSGEVCFEQMLMTAALRCCVFFAERFGMKQKADHYREILEKTVELLEKFWNSEANAYVYSLKNGEQDGVILKHPNLLAILYDLCSEERKQIIIQNVLKNPEVTAITTPYMRFYELSACCGMGDTEYVLGEVRDYWGGMLNEGATTFWEAYDKTETDDRKYAMYGRRFGKSLCHAWGATPLYIIGKYVVGLMPDDFGRSFTLKPDLAGLEYFKATMPLSEGVLNISVDAKRVTVLSTALSGKLYVDGKVYTVEANVPTEVAR